jgi:hypothetical protein
LKTPRNKIRVVYSIYLDEFGVRVFANTAESKPLFGPSPEWFQTAGPVIARSHNGLPKGEVICHS